TTLFRSEQDDGPLSFSRCLLDPTNSFGAAAISSICDRAGETPAPLPDFDGCEIAVATIITSRRLAPVRGEVIPRQAHRPGIGDPAEQAGSDFPGPADPRGQSSGCIRLVAEQEIGIRAEVKGDTVRIVVHCAAV